MTGLVDLTKTPLLICSKRKSCKILRGLGAISLILHKLRLGIDTTKQTPRTLGYGRRRKAWAVPQRKSHRQSGLHVLTG